MGRGAARAASFHRRSKTLLAPISEAGALDQVQPVGVAVVRLETLEHGDFLGKRTRRGEPRQMLAAVCARAQVDLPRLINRSPQSAEKGIVTIVQAELPSQE